jgi:hypothetical protein
VHASQRVTAAEALAEPRFKLQTEISRFSRVARSLADDESVPRHAPQNNISRKFSY